MSLKQLIARTLSTQNTNYGSAVPVDKKLSLFKEEIDKNLKRVYGICDHLFKFFSWCGALTVTVFLWQSTRFGLFLILAFCMIVAILFYIVAISLYVGHYVAQHANRRGMTPRLVFLAAAVTGCVTLYVVPSAFFAGLSRLKRAQACSIYHRDSPNIPWECRKFVRM